MNWVGILLLVIHVIACSGLILIVLLQAGKGASLGAAFGGGSSQTLFGAQSATLIGKATWVLAAAFMCTSLLLAMISPWEKSGSGSESKILQEEPIASPPLGEESRSALPETSSVPMGFSVDTEPVQGDDAATMTVESPIEGSIQPESEAPAVAPDEPASAPDAPAAAPDALSPAANAPETEAEQH
jgi:preprotein translocase subunit SecG